MHDIYKELTERYNIDIKNMVPFKDSFILHTSEGKKLLKKNSVSPERIYFIHGAKEHLYANNFKNIDRYLCTNKGEPYSIINGVIYTVTDLFEGQEFRFDDRNDVIDAARLLASFHKASKGYFPQSSCKDDLGKLPVFFLKRLDEIKKLKKIAEKERNRFDYLFLEHFNYYYRLGEDTIHLLTSSNYHQLVALTRAEGSFCHHDFTYHNMIHSGDKVYLINFEFCCFELKVYDIANFLRRKMRKCNWDIQEAKVIIQEYKKVEDISEDEFLIMRIILQFPQKFWRVINKYYNSRRSWSEKGYVVKLEEVVDEIPYHRNFMENYDLLTKES